MKILVTGGAGFIASHLTDELIARGHEVLIIDDLSTGNYSNVNPQAKLYTMDILSSSLAQVFDDFSPDIVYHHAAQINVQTSLQNPVFDAQVNILGTIAVLENCRDYNVKKIIYASSAAIYGSPEYLSVDEKHPTDPISFYGASKFAPEKYIKIFSNLYDLDYTILRYANAYGPRQDPKGEGGVVSIFTDKLLNEVPPIIYGNGEQTRDFIYVKDIVAANIAALSHGSRATVNISTDTQISINDLLRMMCLIRNVPFAPQYQPSRTGDIMHSQLCNKLAQSTLQWQPRYNLREGIEETFTYYSQKASEAH